MKVVVDSPLGLALAEVFLSMTNEAVIVLPNRFYINDVDDILIFVDRTGFANVLDFYKFS